MGTHRYSISIAAPPEAVYDLFADLDRHAEWEWGNPRITNISSSTLQPGTTYDLGYGRWLTYHARIEVADRPHLFAIAARGPLGLRAMERSEFAPEDGGTRATLMVEVHIPIPLLGRLIEFAILPPSGVRQELERFKAVAEREPDHRSSVE